MPLFSYKARDEKNRIFKGLVEAASETEAQSILEGEDFSILYLRVTKDKRKFFLFPKLTSRLSSKDMVILSRQLATLVSSNLPLVEALDTLVKQSEQQQIKIIVSQVADAVRGGKKLS